MPKGIELLAATKASIASIGQMRVLERNEILLSEGQVEQRIYYVQSGLIRVYLQSEFEEHTIRFGYLGSLINSISSFLRESPSEFFVEAIRKSEVWVLEKAKWEAFLAEDAQRQGWYTELLEEIVAQQMEREVDLLTFSPLERLKRVMERSPMLFQEVPARYIASYLRMTPETLSRIRKA